MAMTLIEKKMQRISEETEQLWEHYRPHMDALSKFPLGRIREATVGSIHEGDYYALGKQLEMYDMFEAMLKEDGSLNLLGKIPNIAHDVITAVQGASVLPIISSVQPIEDEQGTVWFKNIRATINRGAQTAGQTLVDPRTQIVTPSGYSNSKIVNETAVANTVDMTTAYNFTLAANPVRSQTLQLTTSIAGVEALDIGPAEGGDPNVGRIFGNGLSGTINLTTGVVDVTFTLNPGANEQIFATYQQNFEASTELPTLEVFWDHKTIQAQPYVLRGTLGMLQKFTISKRFKMSADADMAKDLVNEINKEIVGDMIKKVRVDAVGDTTFNKTPTAGLDLFSHKQEYKDQLAIAESTLVGNAGRGTISVMIVGRDQAALIETLPGFTKMFDGTSMGVHVYGTLDGRTIVRVTEDAILSPLQGVGLWKGPTPFEAACVYTPYMPLATTDTLPLTNPLVTQKAVAVMAGVDTIVPKFATRYDLVTS